MIEVRDFARCACALVVVFVIDAGLFLAFGLPRDSDAEKLLFALGFTLLCAIREKPAAPIAGE